MRSCTAVTAIVLAAVMCCAPSALMAAKREHEFTVFGYLPEYRLGGFDYEAAFQTGLTHLIYFSLEIDTKTGLPSALDRLPNEEQAAQARAAADKVGGKILLSFGGNARSQGFPTAARTKHSRKKFLKALNDILLKYKFDGVDYNWEYPRNEAEWRQWGHLLRESKHFLLRTKEQTEKWTKTVTAEHRTELQKEIHAQNIVTFTMYLDPNHYDVISHFKLLKDADYVHCMAYDQHGEHSTMEFAKRGIALANQKRFPLHKFTLGLPFYARHVDNMEPKTWYELEELMAGEGEDVDMWQRYYFNNMATIRKKTQLSIDSGIGGVMIWELGQDKQPLSHPRSLMTALNEAAGPALQRNQKDDDPREDL